MQVQLSVVLVFTYWVLMRDNVSYFLPWGTFSTLHLLDKNEKAITELKEMSLIVP